MAVICGMDNDYRSIHSRNCGGDMSDIVERLREEDQLDRDSEMEELLHGEAADEIEILRQALADSDNLEEQLMFRIQDQEAEIATLKQQLAEQREINGRLRQEKVNARVYFEQQLAECKKFDAWKANPYTKILEDSLAECQARYDEPAAWMYPSDLADFQDGEKFAKAFSICVGRPGEMSIPLYLRCMVKELE
jgi:hypothetical protein